MTPQVVLFSSALDRLHLGEQLLIILIAIGSAVHAPMAIRAEANNEPWIVRSAIAKFPDVVRFDVRHAIGSQKWCIVLTSLAFPAGSSDHIVTDSPTSLNKGNRYWTRARLIYSSAEGFFPQIGKFSINVGFNFFCCCFNCLKSAQFEHDGFAHRPGAVWGIFNVIATTDHGTFVAKAAFDAPKEKQVLSVTHVRRDPTVPSFQRHIAGLSFAKILEGSVLAKTVSVSVMKTFVAGDDHHQRISRRSDDASLPLSPEAVMNVSAARVDATLLETPLDHVPSYRPMANVAGVAKDSKSGVAFNLPPVQGTGAGSVLQEIPEIDFPEKADSA